MKVFLTFLGARAGEMILHDGRFCELLGSSVWELLGFRCDFVQFKVRCFGEVLLELYFGAVGSFRCVFLDLWRPRWAGVGWMILHETGFGQLTPSYDL